MLETVSQKPEFMGGSPPWSLVQAHHGEKHPGSQQRGLLVPDKALDQATPLTNSWGMRVEVRKREVETE